MELDAVSEYFLRTSLWPVVFFTVLMMLIGTVGNALVLVIFRHDFQKSVISIFIYFLSALDICACLICMPSELTILTNVVSFPSWAWCTASRYLTYIFHCSSCVILMVIAFDRYDRVCRSASQYMNIRKAKIACLGAFLCSVTINMPSLILYGEAKVHILIQDDIARIIGKEDAKRYSADAARNRSTWQINATMSNASRVEVIEGKMCLIKSEYSGHILEMVFFLIQFVLGTALVILVFYFYSKVIQKIVGYRAKQERLFKLYLPEKRASVKEEETSPNDRLSDDVKTDNLCKDVASADPLGRSPGNSNEAKGKGKKAVDKKDNHVAASKPVTITVVTQEHFMNGRTCKNSFPVSDDKSASSDAISESSNAMQSNKLLSRRIKSAESLNRAYITSVDPLNLTDRTMTINRKSPKGYMKCVFPLSGLSVKSKTSYSHEELNKEPHEDGKPSIDKSESEEKTSVPNSTPDTAERSSKDEQSVQHQGTANIKKKLVSQSCVTFSVAEERNSVRKRSRGRLSDQDSMSPLFGTPASEVKRSSMRSTRSDSLFTPSLKTVDYNRRMSIKPIKALRTSSMLLVISLAFVLSFLPFWIIVIIRAVVGGGFISSLTPTTFGVVSVFIRFYLISNAVNPIVYGLLNNQFRNRCKAIFLRR